MSRGDIYPGRLRSDRDQNRAIRRLTQRLNEIESSVIHQGDGVGSVQGGSITVQIDNGLIRATRNNHAVKAETGTVDNLDGITGGEVGQILALESFFVHQITVRSNASAGTRRIFLNNDIDFLLEAAGSPKSTLFLYRADDAWYEVGRYDDDLHPLPRRVVTILGNTTLDADNDVVLCDAALGAITVTLPPAGDLSGQFYDIKKVDSSANAVTIDGDGSETIDGATTRVLASQYESLTVVSDSTEWWII